MKSKCPLLSRHIYGNSLINSIMRWILVRLGLGEQHHVPNIPCDRTDQHIFLFHHLTYFHKLNAKAATKLIRALILNKDPSESLFHPNDIITILDQPRNSQQHKSKPKKKRIDKEKNSPSTLTNLSTHVRIFADRLPSFILSSSIKLYSIQ